MTNHADELDPVGTTAYHGFREWGLGDWFDYTDEFQAVDEELAMSGTLADRPSSTSNGRYYRATDARTIFRYEPTHDLADAEGWVTVAGAGTSTNPVPGTSHFSQTSVDDADISTLEVGTQASGRVGGLVYYDPDNRGPYTDGQDALADVPVGGTFWIAPGQYDVASEGPLNVSEPCHITGSGVARDGSNVSQGTQLYSTYTLGPVVDIDGDATNTPEQASLANLSIDQREPTSEPLVRINDFTHTHLHDMSVGAAGDAGTAIQYSGKSFFARQHRTRVGGWTNRGISVEGTGYAHEFRECFVSSSASTDHTALYANVARPIIIGGQYSAVGTGGCAIHLDANDAVKRAGGVIIEPGIERTPVPLRVGGTYSRHEVWAKFFAGHLGSDVQTVLDLVNSNDSHYEPMFSTATSGELAAYGSGSIGNTIEVSGSALEDMTISGSPSNRDLILVRSGVGNTQLQNFPTGDARIFCPMNVSEGGPVWHDTANWNTASSTTFTP